MWPHSVSGLKACSRLAGTALLMERFLADAKRMRLRLAKLKARRHARSASARLCETAPLGMLRLKLESMVKKLTKCFFVI
ncbi:MAG: hypothetical protein A3B75_01330 [Candidatus Terrybacteria bacterium RIFCSPHIGHO2_02_FULL_43_14]|nr:MAG: hypothetical protein A3B75_01330 [Candidatus Terrybacteria bacterium RIFCSPHIGHO2_02_FULL_43_14]